MTATDDRPPPAEGARVRGRDLLLLVVSAAAIVGLLLLALVTALWA